MSSLEAIVLSAGAWGAAWLTGLVARRFKVPTVVSELLAGVVLGNCFVVFRALAEMNAVQMVAQFGALLLLFEVGLETDIHELRKVGFDSTRVAVVGVVAPMALAFAALPWLGESGLSRRLFMAAALTATSVGITARVLSELKKLTSPVGRVILGAAVIDDVLGLLLLAALSARVGAERVDAAGWVLLIGKIAGFLLLAALAGWWLAKSFLPWVAAKLGLPARMFLLFTLLLLFAYVADFSGVSAILGAFVVGMVFHRVPSYRAHHVAEPFGRLLVPFFFVVMGMSVDLRAMANSRAIELAAVLIGIAIVGKMISGLGVGRRSLHAGADRLAVGFGMVPRGEVGLVFAAIGQKLGILDTADFGAVVAMVFVTTLVAPALLVWRHRGLAKRILPGEARSG